VIHEILLKYEEFGSLEECPVLVQELYEMAHEAGGKAYAPYSNFKVGVALELADGSRYSASNQENAAYPSGLCAERTALFYANALKPDIAVKTMVLAVSDKNGPIEFPAYPCGACRQVMMESEERGGIPIQIWMIGSRKIHKVDSTEVLLPLKFSFNH